MAEDRERVTDKEISASPIYLYRLAGNEHVHAGKTIDGVLISRCGISYEGYAPPSNEPVTCPECRSMFYRDSQRRFG